MVSLLVITGFERATGASLSGGEGTTIQQAARPAPPRTADPAEPALPATGFKLDLSKAALVVIDPQNDFLSPAGASWAVFGESIVENNTVENLEKLFKAFKAHDLPVAVSPHYYYPHDHDWHFGGPLEKVMHSICMFDRKGPNTLENFEGSGADFLEIYKPYILDGETIIASPHPSPLSASRGFFGSHPFSRANQALVSMGAEPVDWSLPSAQADRPDPHSAVASSR